MQASRIFHPLLLSALVLAAPAWAQNLRKVDPEHLPQYWVMIKQSVDVDIPNSGVNLDKPGCAAISYTIGTDGVPRDLKIEKVVPPGDLGQVALSAVKNFRYGPTLANRINEPVRTYYVVPFNAPPGPDGQRQVMAPCRLTGYGTP